MGVRTGRWAGGLGDAVVAVAVAAVGQLEVWAPEITHPNLVGPRPAIAAFYAVTALALVARRRRPLAVLASIAVLDVAHFVALGASEGMGTLLPLLVATYSVAAHREGAAAKAGLALGIATVVVHELANPDNTDIPAILDAVVWDLTVVAAWLGGAYVRTRRLYTAELSERARRAEHDREQRAAAAVADERARIARELHDVVSHTVSVMVIQAEAADEMLDANPQAARGAVTRIQSTGRDALLELRRMLDVLSAKDASDGLGPQPGLAQLDRLVAQVEHAGLPVELATAGHPMPLEQGIEVTAYRIVQEALTNTLKHAGAARAFVELTYGPRQLTIEVRDDGNGSARGGEDGHGLAGMRQRVDLYGGALDVGTLAGGGFRVCAHLPVGGGT